MKIQALLSSKDNSKKLKCRLLQFLFGALRVNARGVTTRRSFTTYYLQVFFYCSSYLVDKAAAHNVKQCCTNIGIKHGFPCINVPREMLKTEAEGRGFQQLPRDLANVNALENNV